MGALESSHPSDREHQQTEPLQSGQGASPESGQQRFRYRIDYSKDRALRYTSQLDMARVWERVLRRAGMPLVYSQGFNPRPKIQLAVGLPLGYVSWCEVVDVWLERQLPSPASVVPVLNAVSPPGLEVVGIHAIDLHAPALQSIVWSTTYRISFRVAIDRNLLAQRVDDLLAEGAIWRERRDKRYDLRPLIDQLTVVMEGPTTLETTLAASPNRGTARPDDVLLALGIDPANAVITRTAIAFEPHELPDATPGAGE